MTQKINHAPAFRAMQDAVDIVHDSPHQSNKVAATLFLGDRSLSRTNYWPLPIANAFGMNTKIGNSSGTVHAETACILGAGFATDGASLCVTDPFCPNCAKNIAEAGIRTIYIDHKGFDKDFFTRRGDHFETMSMEVCEKAGINVYQLWRKDERIVPITERRPHYRPAEDSPVHEEPVETFTEAVFQHVIAEGFTRHERRKFAVAFATSKKGARIALTARGHAVTGFTMEDPASLQHVESRDEKYTLFQEPVNRVLMHLARRGYDLEDGFFFCSQVPTSREQVNLVGAGVTRITAGDIRKSRDADALAAMRQLSTARILIFS